MPSGHIAATGMESTGRAKRAKSRGTKKTTRAPRKRARDYEPSDGSSHEEEAGADLDEEMDEDELMGGDETLQRSRAMKFTDGCRAFQIAFSKIMSSKASDADTLGGPILSAHKKLVAEKLAEEVEDQKAKGEARKERHLAGERGHIQPLNYLNSDEKFLISVATKGVVKLFNAVNKAQNPQKKLDSSKLNDPKELAKRRKEAFLSELRKPNVQNNAGSGASTEEPGWAPLRDDYMLTSSKLRDWDKDPGSLSASQKTALESSSDDE